VQKYFVKLPVEKYIVDNLNISLNTILEIILYKKNLPKHFMLKECSFFINGDYLSKFIGWLLRT